MRRRPTLKVGNGSFPCESQLRRVTGLRLSNWDASWTPTRNGSCCCDRDMAHTPARRRLRPAAIRNVATMRTQTHRPDAPMASVDTPRVVPGSAAVLPRLGAEPPARRLLSAVGRECPADSDPRIELCGDTLDATTSLSIRYRTTWAYARQPRSNQMFGKIRKLGLTPCENLAGTRGKFAVIIDESVGNPG